MEYSASIEIDRPIEVVFELTNEHLPEWSKIVVEEQLIHKTPEVVGTTFRSVTESNGNRMVFDGTVTNYEPPHLNAVHLIGETFDIETAFTFEDLGGRTRVTQYSSVQGKGFFRLLFKLLGKFMYKSGCKASLKELQNLKQFCETYVAQPNSN